MIPTPVMVNKEEIHLKNGDDTMSYTTDANTLEALSGMTVKNVNLNVPIVSNYIKLGDYSSTLICGKSLQNILLEAQKNIENEIIIIDFGEIKEVSEYFLENYTKFLLETSNKVISINMCTDVSKAFSAYMESGIFKEDDEE